MGNDREAQFDFCPKCGALARGGVCTSCGFGNAPVVEELTQNPYVSYTEQTSYTSQSPYTNQNPYTGQNTYTKQNTYTMPNASGLNQQDANNNAQSASQGANYGSPYSEYANRTAYINGAIPPDVPQKKGNGKVWAIVLTCVGLFILLIVLLGVAVFNLFSKIEDNSDSWNDEEAWSDDYDYEFDDYDNSDDYEEFDYDEFYNDITERAKENQSDDEEEPYVSEDGKTYGFSPEDDYYYELKTILRDDLSYSVTMEEAVHYDDNADIYCSYPVLEGDIPNIDYLNQVIYDEYLYFVEYYEENVKDYMWEEDYFYGYIEGYVTYMDEEKISIVFAEDAEYSDYFILSLYCINIDVENGVVLDNTEILDVDDEFSVDFRIREGEQNESDTLDYYTDQELTEMLSDPVDLILFYTPLGMEVGINHDFGWSTATYKDYEQYLKHF